MAHEKVWEVKNCGKKKNRKGSEERCYAFCGVGNYQQSYPKVMFVRDI